MRKKEGRSDSYQIHIRSMESCTEVDAQRPVATDMVSESLILVLFATYEPPYMMNTPPDSRHKQINKTY